ncbi:lanthionine synthetase LanC family protein [Clostridium sp. UBA6640]|uniref:lanthionine synthetase LanC family protein n=1 Tax=Clostridium sp. UBA6640 TaxID=1946370 RepID=UPI0025C19A5A|nr:lanthionine synthetase LanC family protein [Clostridium sp. UBA6640]
MVNEGIYQKLQNYIDRTLDCIKSDYEKNEIKYIYYADILHLSAIAYKTDEHKDKWEEIGYQMCCKIKDFIENYHTYKNNVSILAGFGYMCYAVELYSQNTGRLKRFSKSMHTLLMKETKSIAKTSQKNYEHTEMSNYDCVSGVSGVLYYLLDYRDDDELYKETIEEAIKYLVKLASTHNYKDEMIYNFHIQSQQQFNDEEKVLYPNGNFNFGMAHGVIAPLVALSKAYSYGYKNENLKTAINTILKFYNDFRVIKNGISYWPGQLSFEEYKNNKVEDDSIHYACSWCYGNIGILRGLMLTAQNMELKDLSEFYKSELIKVLELPLEQFYVVSPALCHGYSSVLAAKICLMNESSGQSMEYGIDKIIDKIISLSEYNTDQVHKDMSLIENKEGRLEGCIGEYSLLSGVTGIILVFLDLLYGVNNYKKILMLI